MNHAMTRAELTEKILQIRIDRDLTWKWIAEQSGLSGMSRPMLQMGGRC